MFLFVRVDRSYCAFFTPTQITTSLFRSEKNVLGSSLQVGNKVRDEKNCHGKKYINLGFYGVWENFLVCYTMEKENNFPKFIFSLTLS